VELRALARRARAAQIALSRRSGAEFNKFVLRDEETGGPVHNSPAHEEWHQLFDRHRRVVLWSHIESGKTASVSIGRCLFEIGNNQDLRICIVSNTGGQSAKIVMAIAGYIQRSERLHLVFPRLVPALPWTQTAITVQRDSHAKDPSIQCTGVHGHVLGSRIDLLILDDILGYENTRTKAQREELLRWYKSTLAGRMTRHGRVIAVGTAWHPEDLMHHLATLPGWMHRRFSVVLPSGESAWPERWPLDRVARTRGELGPLEAARQLDCRPSDDESERFKTEWIDRCKREGDGYGVYRSLAELLRPGERLPKGAFVAVGVDVGASLRADGAKTVLFCALFYPDGVAQVLCIEAGHLTGPQIVERCIEMHLRYNAMIFVEDNGAQRFLLQFAERLNRSVPILPHNTGSNKNDPVFGITSIGVELYRGGWIIPNDRGECDPEVSAWIADMRAFRPEVHTGDYLMASWICREGARWLRNGRLGRVSVQVFGPEDANAEEELPLDELDEQAAQRTAEMLALLESLQREAETAKETGDVAVDYFDRSAAPKRDIQLQLAVHQGYVPSRCLLGGGIVLAEMRAGRDPCAGCDGPRVRCGGRPCVEKVYREEIEAD
jgi:hypothetical protein